MAKKKNKLTKSIKRKLKELDRIKRDSAKAAPVPVPPPWFNVSTLTLSNAQRKDMLSRVPVAFVAPQFPPSVKPDKTASLAMDEAIIETNAWASQQIYSGAFFNGVTFMGYPFLSELAQRPEYRRISEVTATEMTREWITLKAKGSDRALRDSKTAQIDELTAEMKRLDVQGAFRKMVELDGFFGRGHLYIDVCDADDREELKMSIGDGDDDRTAVKFKGRKKGFIKEIKPIEPVWCYPSNYNANDPLQKDWYNPQSWFVQGKEVHGTRLLTFVGREVPDMLKPAYAFGGLSLSQMAKPYIDNWLRTRQAVGDLVVSFSVKGVKTNMESVNADGGVGLLTRGALFTANQNNQGIMFLDKESEDFFNITTPLSSLDALQAQSQEHMCSVVGIPVVKLLGIQPAGLNASSEGELTTWYEWVAAYQEKFFSEKLKRVIHFIMWSLWGQVDHDIEFEFLPLRSPTEKEKSDMRKADGDRDVALVAAGIVDPLEVREKMSTDPESGYDGINVDDVPEPPVVPGAEGQGDLFDAGDDGAGAGLERDETNDARRRGDTDQRRDDGGDDGDRRGSDGRRDQRQRAPGSRSIQREAA